MSTQRPLHPPTTAEQAALIPALIDRLLTPAKSAFDVPQLPLIRSDALEFVALKTKPHVQLLGLDPGTTPLAMVISLATPAQTVAKFGSIDAALEAGNRLQHGAALLYGLQTSAMRHGDSSVAEAMVRFAPQMRINFQFERPLLDLIEPARFDAILLEMVTNCVKPKDAMVWVLLEGHTSWSERLSEAVIAAVRAHGAEPTTAVWIYRGNGFAENMHPTRVSEAIDSLRPFVKTQANAKRWITKLKKRSAPAE